MDAEERKARDAEFAELMKSLQPVRPEARLQREMVEARRRAGLSQKELARRMGTTQSVITRLECGRRSPSVKTLRRLAEVTGSRLVVRFEDRGAID